ncbi:hypothetical protein U91I_02768 [alpha proteobacterium U9-1i]|nr:hypothetical protein U91I_02768 [alpha proteobacterium U9-1i]
MTIDVSGFSRIGDMTSGGGLSAVFDGSTSTNGYAEATTGYAGIDFGGSPKRISKAELVSATNGFDASGATTDITLSLYGKNGAAPSGAADGVLLGVAGPFGDVNAQTTRTILSTDVVTQYRYVWAVISTGVWAIATEVRLFESVEPTAPTGERLVIRRSCDEVFPLTWDLSEIPHFHVTARLNDPAVARLFFQVNVTHRGEFTSYMDVVGFGFLIEYRHAATFANLAAASWTTAPNAISGGNIIDRGNHHYGAATIVSAMNAAAGFYEFRVRGSAHSTGSSLDGLAAVLAEYGVGLNNLLIEFDEGSELRTA